MEKLDYSFFESLAVPRPVGSENNVRLQARLARMGTQLGYDMAELPFDCFTWEHAPSFLEHDGKRLTVSPSPFSPPVDESADLLFIDTLEALRTAQVTGRIVVLHGVIASEPLMPKNFPFFEVPEHKEIAELLESGQPLAVLSATGKHPACGLNPCPMFEDCYFQIPSAFFPASRLETLMGVSRGRVLIDSRLAPSTGKQIVFQKKSAGENPAGMVMVCAHMDTAYGTPGALDNASGLYVMMKLMERLAEQNCRYDVQFVPFNGEDYADVSGQRAYLKRYSELDKLRLVINIDGVGYRGSKNALSLYNFPAQWDTRVKQALADYPLAELCEPWFEGDHSMFTAQGIPALALVSSSLDALTAITHTEQDTVERVDFPGLETLALLIHDLLAHMEILVS